MADTEHIAKRARNRLLVFFGVWLTAELLLLLNHAEKIAGVRLILTIALFLLVLRGVIWARYITIFLCYVAAALSLVFVATFFSANAIYSAIFMMVTVFLGALGTFLLKSKDLQRYFVSLKIEKSSDSFDAFE